MIYSLTAGTNTGERTHVIPLSDDSPCRPDYPTSQFLIVTDSALEHIHETDPARYFTIVASSPELNAEESDFDHPIERPDQ